MDAYNALCAIYSEASWPLEISDRAAARMGAHPPEVIEKQKKAILAIRKILESLEEEGA